MIAETLARRLKACKPSPADFGFPVTYRTALDQWQRCVNHAGQALADLDAAFDRVAFRLACGA